MTKTRSFLIAGVVAGAAAAATALTLMTTASGASPITDGAGLAQACATAPIGAHGLAQVTLTNSLTVQGGLTTISVPCQIHLTNGASLSIHNATLVTDKLAIMDDATAAGAPSAFNVDNSKLSSATGGFFVQFQHAQDNISVQHSTFDYPLSIGLATSDAAETGNDGKLDVESSTFRSTGSATEGITIVSTGVGQFVGNSFTTTAADPLALIYAHTCHMSNNTGAVPRCQAR